MHGIAVDGALMMAQPGSVDDRLHMVYGRWEREQWRHCTKSRIVLWAHLNVPEIIFKVKS